MIRVIFGPYGHAGAFGAMVTRFVPNSDFGGCSGAPVMPIFVSHVGPHFLVLVIFHYMEVYEGI